MPATRQKGKRGKRARGVRFANNVDVDLSQIANIGLFGRQSE